MAEKSSCIDCGYESPTQFNACPSCGKEQPTGIRKALGIYFAYTKIKAGDYALTPGELKQVRKPGGEPAKSPEPQQLQNMVTLGIYAVAGGAILIMIFSGYSTGKLYTLIIPFILVASLIKKAIAKKEEKEKP